MTPGDGEGTKTPTGVHCRASAPAYYWETSTYRPPLSLRRHSNTFNRSNPPSPLTETPQTQAEVQRQDRPGGSHHTDVTNAPWTRFKNTAALQNVIAIFQTGFMNLRYYDTVITVNEMKEAV